MISFDEALRRTLESVRPLEKERQELIDATGRILAEDLHSLVESPTGDVSLKDGYAVRSPDVAKATDRNPETLRVVGEISAGGVWSGELRTGEAVRILSGGRIPASADAVIAVEFTSIDGDLLTVTRDAGPGRNILVKGSDLRRDDNLVKGGTALEPGNVGLLAAGGHGDVSVYKRPRIGILATGDEVLSPGEPISDGKVYASNLVTLASWCTRNGWPVETRVVPDDYTLIQEGLETYLAECDVVLTSGGAWKGQRDLVVDILDQIGWTKIFHRVKIGPGKAAGFGLYSSKLVFCLPGGPPSNLMAFLQLAIPGIRKLGGWADPSHPLIAATLQKELRGQVDWTQFVYGQVANSGDTLAFFPMRLISRLSEMASFNALAKIPEGISEIKRGSRIQVQLLSAPIQASNTNNPPAGK
jgi:molybdopterin molybdotransferase